LPGWALRADNSASSANDAAFAAVVRAQDQERVF